jgi:ATP-dependent RNA helicase DeaD
MTDGYNADALHGDLSQSQRDYVMGKFRNGNIQLLVATDVAARGIDINELTHVINYNLPDENEVYVHRSGRTGRAGRKGTSIIIAHSREGRKVKAIEKMIKQKIIAQKVPSGKDICKIQLMHLIDTLINSEINSEINQYIPEIESKFKKIKKSDLIKQVLSVEFNRLLSFYKNSKDLDVSIKENNTKRKPTNNTGLAEKGYNRFFINIGKENGIATHNLIGLINEHTKNRNIPVGKIDIMKKFSFFEIPSNFKDEVLKGFVNSRWKEKKLNVEISKIPKEQKSSTYSKKKPKQKSRKKQERRKDIKKNKRGKSSSFKNRFKESNRK